MEHKIVIEGQGSAHPKLGVKKKNSVEENLKILNDMIESGKLSLDHAIAKTRPGGTLRGIFKCSEDDEMLSHVEALYDPDPDPSWGRPLGLTPTPSLLRASLQPPPPRPPC